MPGLCALIRKKEQANAGDGTRTRTPGCLPDTRAACRQWVAPGAAVKRELDDLVCDVLSLVRIGR